MVDNLSERIHEANITVHRFEAKYYEVIHPEVFGNQEQKRIDSILDYVDNLIVDNERRALDFGAGTGNLTDKLLDRGYRVIAVDISTEMCSILQKKNRTFLENGKLIVTNSPVEDLSFQRGEFDLITGYSVLHHLPDYSDTIESLSGVLKKGGVMYLDHEAAPSYWKSEPNMLAHLVKSIYFHSNPLLNSLYFRMRGMNVPFQSMDYTFSDYWHKREHPLDHNKIRYVFEKECFDFFVRKDYHLYGSWLPNPVFNIYRLLCEPEMSYWLAKK
jgi:2-polyprenyl-3-methyl-5-hydroxy-6-metoxy-1,4-benzoquinol methylase